MRSGQGPAEASVGVSGGGARQQSQAAEPGSSSSSSPSVAVLPPAAWLGGPRDPWLIELHPLIRLSLRQLAANLKYGCLLSYLTLLPPTRCCCRHTYTHSHTHTLKHTHTHTHTLTHTHGRVPNIFRGHQSWPVLLFFFCIVLPCKSGHLSAPGPHHHSLFAKQPTLANRECHYSKFVFLFVLRFVQRLRRQLCEGMGFTVEPLLHRPAASDRDQ